MKGIQIAKKLRSGLWHLQHTARVKLADRLAARIDRLSRLSHLLRYPLPGLLLYRRSELHLVRGGALGDVLMCTPALRRLRELNPGCHVTFYTQYRILLDSLPFVDEVRPGDGPLPDCAIELG
jgi:hypothetical protein